VSSAVLVGGVSAIDCVDDKQGVARAVFTMVYNLKVVNKQNGHFGPTINDERLAEPMGSHAVACPLGLTDPAPLESAASACADHVHAAAWKEKECVRIC